MKILFFIIAIMLNSPAIAQNVNCDNPTNRVDADYCAGLERETAEKELKIVWKQAIDDAKETDLGIRESIKEYHKDLNPDEAAGAENALRQSQRAWHTYKDKTCSFVYHQWFGGTGASIASTSCETEIIKERTRQLKDIITPKA